jgi:hypothetical protein
LLKEFIPNTVGYAEKYSWETISKKILKLAK